MPRYSVEFRFRTGTKHNNMQYDNEVHKGDFITCPDSIEYCVEKVVHKPSENSYILAAIEGY